MPDTARVDAATGAPRFHRSTAPPRSAVIVGAGVVGLACAWYLQEAGVEVTVAERDEVAAGSSWGNAGWLSPGLAVPLPEASVLRFALRSVTDPASALYVPLRWDPSLWAWLSRFARHCTTAQWRRAMAALVELNRYALDAYDQLTASGVAATITEAPVVTAFEAPGEDGGFLRELDLAAAAGQPVDAQPLSGDQARAIVPQLSDRVASAWRLGGQRYLDPGAFVRALAESVVARGGRLATGFAARTLRRGPRGVTVAGWGSAPLHGDVAVVAAGAWLDGLVRPLGVRVRVRAGRGYSFSLATDRPLACPVYFPVPRVACTPYRGGVRVAGTMEFRGPDAPLDFGRVDAIVARARPLLRGVDWASLADPWVGGRPVTPDGLPLIGRSADPAVHVAGGHGMWGMTLGPVTGRLLAEAIVSGETPAALRPFDPRR